MTHAPADRNVIPMQRHGNCLFCAASYSLYVLSKMRLSILNKIIKEWEYYKDFIMELSMVINFEDSNNLLSLIE